MPNVGLPWNGDRRGGERVDLEAAWASVALPAKGEQEEGS